MVGVTACERGWILLSNAPGCPGKVGAEGHGCGQERELAALAPTRGGAGWWARATAGGPGGDRPRMTPGGCGPEPPPGETGGRGDSSARQVLQLFELPGRPSPRDNRCSNTRHKIHLAEIVSATLNLLNVLSFGIGN